MTLVTLSAAFAVETRHLEAVFLVPNCLLLALLVVREVLSSFEEPSDRALRALDVAIAPLFVVFLATLALGFSRVAS